MSDYMNESVGLYLNELIDWESYFARRKGDDVDVEAERAALFEVVQTAAAICSEMEDACRAGWLEHPRLEDGVVTLPAHIQAFYDKLAQAGLVSWGVTEEYEGFGLPSFVGNLIMQMVSRADAGDRKSVV